MFLRKAMRYYRLWIYSCNAVLFASVVVFLGVSVGVLSHPYVSLIPSPRFYHPTVLYGYIALILQAGILQAIGCIGAFRLSQKLLNIYWSILLSLLLGDILVGLVWLIRFSTLTVGIQPLLSNTISIQYNEDINVKETWNNLQTVHKCCGAQGPFDYTNVSVYLPDSCCHPNEMSSDNYFPKNNQLLNHVANPGTDIRNKNRPLNNTDFAIANIPAAKHLPYINCREKDYRPHSKNCSEFIIKWYSDSVETLMIFGFCVITFIKLCFVGILRFEIQEMIQKIKILQGESVTSPDPELAVALGMVSPDHQIEETALICSEDVEIPKSSPEKQTRDNHIFPYDVGQDFDANSYSALITETPNRANQSTPRKYNGNNNDITELRQLCHIRQTQI